MAMKILDVTIFPFSVHIFAWDSENQSSMSIFSGPNKFQVFANTKGGEVRKNKFYSCEKCVSMQTDKLEEYFRDVMETGEEVKEPVTA